MKSFKTSTTPQTNFRHFSIHKEKVTPISSFNENFTKTSKKKDTATKKTPTNLDKLNNNFFENTSYSLENIETKDLIEKTPEGNSDNKVTLTIESYIKDKENDGKNKSNINSINLDNKILMLDQKFNNSSEFIDNSNKNIKKNDALSSERTFRSKSIGKKSEKLGGFESRNSRRSVISDNKSIFTSLGSQIRNSNKSFSDFSNDLYFSYRKSAETMKKSNFGLKEEDQKLFMVLRPVEQENIKINDGVKENISLISEENNENNKSNEEQNKNKKEENQNKQKKKAIIPKICLPDPKYFHKHVTKIINADKSFNYFSKTFREKSTNKNYIEENKKNTHTTRTISSHSQGKQQVAHMKNIKSQLFQAKLSPKATNQINTSRNMREFYMNLLRKVELLRFSVDLFLIRENHKQKNKPSISIDAVKLESSNNDFEVFEVIGQKFGQEYYAMLNRIYSFYAVHKQNCLHLNLRQFLIFLKEFFPDLMKKQFFANLIEILYKKVVKSPDFCDLKGFIELLFEIHKIKKAKSINKNQENKENKDISRDTVKEKSAKKTQKIHKIIGNPQIPQKELEFKNFLEENLIPTYKRICTKMKEHSFEKIQIFFENYDENSNPIIDLFIEKDDLLKHIFSVYEILDIKFSKNSFINLNGFLKFGSDYCVIPDIANAYQMRKIFMTYKRYENDIIDFPCFIILICCIAHIGLNNLNMHGFYGKIKLFFDFLQRKNTKISSNLIVKKLLK